MKIYECTQGSEEWFKLRVGRPTASEFGRIIQPKKRLPSAGMEKYINQLIGEQKSLYMPNRVESYTSNAVRWGEQTEEEGRRWYSMETGLDVWQVGFCMTDDSRFGCSPDGLIEPDGGLELKCPQPATHVGYLRKKEVPTEYLPQVHGALIVTGRAWWDFLSYAPGLPALLVRTVPDDFTEALRGCLEIFWEKYAKVFESISSI